MCYRWVTFGGFKYLVSSIEVEYQSIVLVGAALRWMCCRYENGEKEHCLELWNRDGKVSLELFWGRGL